MLRYEGLENISDGRRYGLRDMARIDTMGCAGCSKCCESDMGKSIVLTPYDMYNLSLATGRTFDSLLSGFIIELSVIDGLILPNIKMDSGCGFLKDGRCSIHAYRPDICRLFPMGRVYEGDSYFYINQVGECPAAKSKIKVSKWIGVDDGDRYSSFIMKWHRFRRNTEKRVEKLCSLEGGDIVAKELMKCLIRDMYLEQYDTGADFYPQFEERLKTCVGDMREISGEFMKRV